MVSQSTSPNIWFISYSLLYTLIDQTTTTTPKRSSALVKTIEMVNHNGRTLSQDSAQLDPKWPISLLFTLHSHDTMFVVVVVQQQHYLISPRSHSSSNTSSSHFISIRDWIDGWIDTLWIHLYDYHHLHHPSPSSRPLLSSAQLSSTRFGSLCLFIDLFVYFTRSLVRSLVQRTNDWVDHSPVSENLSCLSHSSRNGALDTTWILSKPSERRG